MATELKQKRCHLCEKEVRSASWRSVPSILKAPKGAQWCYRGVCRTVGRHLLKTTRGESTPFGAVSSRTRHNLTLQHKHPKPRPNVTRLLACLDLSPPFVRIVAFALHYTAHWCISRLPNLSKALQRARGSVHLQKGHIAKVWSLECLMPSLRSFAFVHAYNELPRSTFPI